MKKSKFPETRVKNPEPNYKSPDWVIWAAWADRITFEEIKKKQESRSQKLSKLWEGIWSLHHLDFGGKEQKERVLSTEKNLF